MDYAWYLFGFKGRLNRANVWLAVPIILCLLMLLGILAMTLSKLFGGPKSISINIDDIFALLDPEFISFAVGNQSRSSRHQGDRNTLLPVDLSGHSDQAVA